MLCVGLALGLTGLAGLAGPGTDRPSRPSQPASLLPAVDGQSARMAAAQDLLFSRAAAVRARSKRAWMATVDRPGSAFGRRQSLAFDNILKLPISEFSYSAVTSGSVTSVRGSYLLAGFDRTPRSFEATYTLVKRPGGWRISDDSGGSPAIQLWDLPGLQVIRTPSGIVVGNAPMERMRHYGAVADVAVRRVNGVWGTDWNSQVVLVTPSTAEEFTRLLGHSADKEVDRMTLSQVAAVTQGRINPDQRAQGDQIVINPKAFKALQPDGRRMVVTHELTHVAVRSSTTRPVPTWLSEGLADYVGYTDLALPRERVASELLTLVRAGKGPASLPTAADFDTSRIEIATAYSASWLAVCRLVDLYGLARVVAFYRATAGGPTAYKALRLDPDASAALAFPRSFGVTQPQFVEGWQRYLQSLAHKRQ